MTVDVGIRVLVIGAGQARQALSSADSALTKLTKTVSTADTGFAKFSKSMTNIGRSISGIGSTLTTSLTLPILGLQGALVGAGIEFQDAFQGIAKTVDGVSDSMGNLTEDGEALKTSLLEMSLIVPVSPIALANLGQLAGQFGETKDTVELMIDTLAKLQVSTDLVAESQLQAFAQVSKLTGTVADEYDNLGSSLVFLGNNFATTESAVISFSQRIAGTTTALGFSADATLAWAAAVTASGITAQTGATALRKAILEMTKAVDGGGKSLTKFAELATTAFQESGMSAEEFSETFGVSMDILEDGIISAQEFAQIFGEDASGALELFVRGLSGLEATEALGTLDELGLGAQRVGATMINLAGNTDVLRDALAGSAIAYEEQVALLEEAQKKFNTLKSTIQLAKNAFIAIGDTIATLVADDIKELVDGVVDLTRKFLDMDEGTQRTILAIAGVAAAIGPLLIVAGTLISVLGTIGTALAAVSLPALAVVTAIVAIGAAFVALSKNSKVRGFLSGIGESFKKVASSIAGLKIPDLFSGNVFDKLVELGENILPTIGNFFEIIGTRIATFAESFANAFTPFVEQAGPDIEALFVSIGGLIESLTPLLESIGTAFTEIFGEVDAAGIAAEFGEIAGVIAGITFDSIVAGVQLFVNLLTESVAAATTFFSELPAKLEEFGAKVQEVFTSIGEAIEGAVGEENFARIQELPEKVAEIFTVLKDRALEKLGEFGDKILEWVDEKVMPVLDDISEWASEALKVFSDWASDVIADVFDPFFNDIKSSIDDWIAETIPKFQEWVEEVLDWFDELYNAVVGNSIIPDLVNDIIKWINTLVTDGVAAFSDFVNGVIEVVGELGGIIGELIGEALGGLFESIGDGEGLAGLFDLSVLEAVSAGFVTLGETINMIQESLSIMGETITVLFELISVSIVSAIENFNILATTITTTLPAGLAAVTNGVLALNAAMASLIPIIATLGASYMAQFITPAEAGTTQFASSFQSLFGVLPPFFKQIVDLMVGHWLEFTAATLSATQELKSELDAIFTRLEKDNVVKFKVMGREFGTVVDEMVGKTGEFLTSLSDVSTSTEGLASAFGSVGAAAHAAADEVEAAAEAMCAAMEEAEACITGSPELAIQHPFERFSSFLKTETPKIEDELVGMFAPAITAELTAARATSAITNNTTTITEDNSISLTGIPIEDEDNIGEQLISVQRSLGGNR